MAFNTTMNMAMLAAASASISETKNKLDIQNAVRYANFLYSKNNEKVALDKETEEKFNCEVVDVLEWQSILGEGYTAMKPKKLLKYLELYKGRKLRNLYNFILDTYDEKGIMSSKELADWAQDMLDCLSGYCKFAEKIWDNDEEGLLTSLDDEYYNYAKECYNDIFGSEE